jgi:hypothetical protein
MRSRFHRKIGFMFGLLAILLVTLAPVVSQTLVQSGHGALSNSLCSAQSSAGDATDHHHPSGNLAQHGGQACGYCHFFTHAPALPSVVAVFALVIWAIQQRIATRFQSVRRFFALNTAQPRAPPLAS